MKLRSVAADLDQALSSFLVEVLVPGIQHGDSEYVKIDELIGHFCPERLESFGGVSVLAHKGIAESKQVARLLGIGLIAQHRRERRYGIRIVAAFVLDQADVEA